MAPEVLQGDVPYTTSVDVFSFGIFLWCLCAADRYPYSSELLTPIQAANLVSFGVLRPRRLQRMKDAPELWNLICLCWAQNAQDRPSMKAVLHTLMAIREDICLNRKQTEENRKLTWSYWAWDSMRTMYNGND